LARLEEKFPDQVDNIFSDIGAGMSYEDVAKKYPGMTESTYNAMKISLG